MYGWYPIGMHFCWLIDLYLKKSTNYLTHFMHYYSLQVNIWFIFGNIYQTVQLSYSNLMSSNSHEVGADHVLTVNRYNFCKGKNGYDSNLLH